MKLTKRVLSLLLTLLMVVGCLSGLTFTVSAAMDYSLWIGGVRVTSDNLTDVLGDGNGGTGSVSYDPYTQTLTLNNAAITSNGSYDAFIEDSISSWDSALTIELVGTNTIDGTAAGMYAYYGIQSQGRLNIRGSGSLTISNIRWNGIEAQSLYFDDPDDADRPTVTVTANRYGILARNITIYNAEIHATTTATERNNSSAYQKCEAAGIVAYNVSTASAGFITLGAGSTVLHENNVLIDAHCQVSAYACYAIASSGSIDVTSTTAITTPAGGSFDSGWGGAQTVVSGVHNALDVGITATPFPENYAEYPLWVGGTHVNTVNMADVLGDGTVSYDPATNVLSLNNAAITGDNNRAHIMYQGSGSSNATLTLQLTGANTLSNADGDCSYGLEVSSADLRFTGSGTLTVRAKYDAIYCAGNSLLFDDESACPTVNVTAGRFGVWTRDLTMYQGNLSATSTCARPMNDSPYNGFRATGILAEGSITVGDGTMDPTKNNVHLAASCSVTDSNYSPLYAKTAIVLPDRTTAITTPAGGCVGGLNAGYTVYDSNGARVTQVVIEAQGAAPTRYGVWFNGVEFTEVNLTAGLPGVSFDPAANTLHVTQNLTLAQDSGASGASCVLYSTLEELTLDIAAGCTLTLRNQDYGIYALGNVHIPNGSLTVSGVQTGVFCGGSLYFDGEDTAKQPLVTVTATKNAVAAGSVYLWNVDLEATVTGTPGAGETAADYAAIRAEGTETGSGVLRFGETGAAAWKNNTAVNASSPNAQAIYARNGLLVSDTLGIRLPAICLPYGSTEITTLRNGATDAPATVVQIMPRDAGAETYGLWLGGVQVTADNRNDVLGNGAAAYVLGLTGNTLYLDRVNIPTSSSDYYVYYTESKPLTIVLIGENVLGVGFFANRSAYGIQCTDADLHVVGSGSLSLMPSFHGIHTSGDLYFDDPVNRPTVSFEGVAPALLARNIYIDRAEIHVFTEDNNTEGVLDDNCYCISAAVWAQGTGNDAGTLRIGTSGGSDNVLLDVTASTRLFYEPYWPKVFAIFAGSELILAENEKIVTPAGGGLYDDAHLHTVIAPTGDTAYTVRIEPQQTPAQIESYALWLNGYQVNVNNKSDLPGLNGSWFDPYSSTLHLLGETSIQPMVVNSLGCGIYSAIPDLKIVLEEGCAVEIGACAYGIYAAENCSVHIRGSGALSMPDVRTRGIHLSGSGDLYFDESDPDVRPLVEINSTDCGLMAHDIFFWNVNLYLVADGSAVWSRFPVVASNDVYFGSDAAGEAWKNNAVVYVTNRYAPAILAGNEIHVSQKESVWLPNNATVITLAFGSNSYYQTFKDAQITDYSWGVLRRYAPSIYISPKVELPDGETPVDYNLWINGVRVTSLNQDMLPGLGGSYYDPATTTLHLSGKLVLGMTSTVTPKDAVIYAELDNLSIALEYAQVYLCTERDEDGNVPDYGIYNTGDLNIRGDGRITVGNSDKAGIYTRGAISFAVAPAPDRADYAYYEEYVDAYEEWQSNLLLVPEVNVYSRTYGIRCTNLTLESVRLNAIVFTAHNVGTESVAGQTVPNAAVLAVGNVEIGTTTGELYRNAVTAPELSCSLAQDEGYAIYAGAIHLNSASCEIIKPVGYTLEANGHYVLNSQGSAAPVVTIATPSATTYRIRVEQPDYGVVYLDGHEALCAKPGEAVTVRVAPENANYTLSELTVSYGSTVLPLDVTQPTASFTMPAEDVTVSAVIDFYGNEILIDDSIEHGAVAANHDRAAPGDTVTLTFTPDDGYELDTLTVTNEDTGTAVTVTDGQFTMPDAEVTVTASFRAVLYSVTVSCGSNGTASADLSQAYYGDVVTLTVTPAAQHRVDVLAVMDEHGNRIAVNANNEFLMPASDVTVSVTFATQTYTITVLEVPYASARVNAVSASEGSLITLYADGGGDGRPAGRPIITAENGETVEPFHMYSAHGATYEWYFYMPASNVTVTPTFYYYDYSIIPNGFYGNGHVTAQATAHVDETVVVTVFPDEGYELERLFYSGESHSVDITQLNGVYSFTMPAQNINIYSKFRKIDYTVAINSGITNGTVAADCATANFGDTVTVTVTPDPGFQLDGLGYRIRGGELVGIPYENGAYRFTMPSANVMIEAVFGVLRIPYVDAQGNSMPAVSEFTALDADASTLSEGWWVVTESVTNANRLTVSGSVNLILCDGATLTASKGICVGGGGTLTIWAQSHGDGCGKLVARTTNEDHAAIGSNAYTVGTIVINGGEIDALSSGYGAGIGGGQHSGSGSITINNGVVTAQGGNNAAGIGGGRNNWAPPGHYGNLDNISITGGEVTAIGMGYAAGIGGGGAVSPNALGGNSTEISITGGKVTATSQNGHGIGSGLHSAGGDKNGVCTAITLGCASADDYITSGSFAASTISTVNTLYYQNSCRAFDPDNPTGGTLVAVQGPHNFANGVCTVCGAAETGTDDTLTYDQVGFSVEGVIKAQFAVYGWNHTNPAYDSYYMIVTHHKADGTDETSEPIPMDPNVVSGYTFYVGYYDVYATYMADDLDVTVCGVKDGVTYTGLTTATSVRAIAGSALTNTSDSAARKRVYADMLAYGAQAQLRFGYNTDDLANALTGEELTAYNANLTTEAPAYETLDSTGSTPAGMGEEKVTVYSTALSVEERVYMQFGLDFGAFDVADFTVDLRIGTRSVAVTDSSLVEIDPNYPGYYALIVDSIDAVEGRTPVSFTIYEGQTPVSKTYVNTIENLAAGKTGDDALLASRLVRFYRSIDALLNP